MNYKHEKWSGEVIRSAVLVVGVKLDAKRVVLASSMTEIRSAIDMHVRSKTRKRN